MGLYLYFSLTINLPCDLALHWPLNRSEEGRLISWMLFTSLSNSKLTLNLLTKMSISENNPNSKFNLNVSFSSLIIYYQFELEVGKGSMSKFSHSAPSFLPTSSSWITVVSALSGPGTWGRKTGHGRRAGTYECHRELALLSLNLRILSPFNRWCL